MHERIRERTRYIFCAKSYTALSLRSAFEYADGFGFFPPLQDVHSISPKDANFILDVGSRKPSLNRKERLAF